MDTHYENALDDNGFLREVLWDIPWYVSKILISFVHVPGHQQILRRYPQKVLYKFSHKNNYVFSIINKMQAEMLGSQHYGHRYWFNLITINGLVLRRNVFFVYYSLALSDAFLCWSILAQVVVCCFLISHIHYIIHFIFEALTFKRHCNFTGCSTHWCCQ